MSRRTSISGLLLAGAAAYGIYKLSKLTAEERNGLLDKGKKLVSENIPGLKSVLNSNGADAANGKVNNFSEEVSYGG